MSEELFGSLFEQSVQKKKDKIAEQKQSEREKRKAEKAKAREAKNKAEQKQNTNNKKRKNNGEDLNTKNKKQKTGSGDSKKVSVEQLRNDIRSILSGVPVVGDEDVDNLDDLNLDEIDVDSDADQVSIGDDDREEFECHNDTPKKGKNNQVEAEEEPEAEFEDENAYSKEQKTLWMGNVPLEANKTKLIDFYKDCGKINDIRFLTQGQIRDSQVVFLEFKTMQAAKKALKKQGQIFLGRKIKLRFAGDKNGPAPSKSNSSGNKGPVSSNSLFVKNLSFKTTELHLREIFGECGEIATVRLPTFPDTGKPTGFGFVDFADPSGLSNALQMNRVDCLGRQLLLEAAAVKNKEDKFKNNNNAQAPREAGSYNFGPRAASAPKPNIHTTFDNDDNNEKPKKKGKKQYAPKKRE